MAKNIKQMAEEYALSQVLSCTDTKMTQQAYLSIKMFNGYDVACGYKDGANYVLEQIENFMKGLDLGNRAEEKFYKLDILADIGLFIEQLKK